MEFVQGEISRLELIPLTLQVPDFLLQSIELGENCARVIPDPVGERLRGCGLRSFDKLQLLLEGPPNMLGEEYQ